MFHLYFGAFDLVCYAIAGLIAISVANAFCDLLEQPPACLRSQIPLSEEETFAEETISLSKRKEPRTTLLTFDLKTLVATSLTGNSDAEKQQAITTIQQNKPSAEDWQIFTCAELRKLGSRLGVTNSARMAKGDIITQLVAA